MLSTEIKKLRETANISQEQLAETINKSTNTVSRYERGELFPCYKTLYKIIEIFDVDTNTFFSRKKPLYSVEAILILNLFSQMQETEKKTIINFRQKSLHPLNFTETNHIVSSKENKLGVVIKELREKKNISQALLAESISKSTSIIGQFERGEVFPSYETLYSIIEFWDVDANLLFPRKKPQYLTEAIVMLNLFSQMQDDERKTIINFYQNLLMLLSFTKNDQIADCEGEELT